jgi:NADPH:quinone reductase
MKAAYYVDYGSARDVLKVGELPTPEPQAGEVLVRMCFSGINPSDCKRRQGIRDRPGYPLIIPHNDGAGVIEKTGPGVDSNRIGERVWIWSGQRRRAFGTAAEYIAIASANAVELPDNVTFEQGACLGVPAMTAYQSLFADGDIKGLRVLVTGGAGAVGHYAIQFAKLAGASLVIATVSGSAKAARAERAGADVVLNYKTDDVAARVLELTSGNGVDRISEVDLGVNMATTTKVMANNASIGAYGSVGNDPAFPLLTFIFRDVNVRFQQCSLMPMALREEGTKRIMQWCSSGKIVHAIGRIFSLDDVAEAHETVENGSVIGNVLLENEGSEMDRALDPHSSPICPGNLELAKRIGSRG